MKGVTAAAIEAALLDIISIHTPVKGVTEWIEDGISRIGISIHTPVKGVTGLGLIRTLRHRNFNPHTREGCDGRQMIREAVQNIFQSTHP